MQKEDKILGEIRQFADRAHGGQIRKYTNERYIVHPWRVMEIIRDYNQDMAVLAAAILHDVLEDTPVTSEEIYKFICGLTDEATAKRTVKLVLELTDVFTKNDYPQWNRKKRKAMELERIVRTSADAQTIKYADIMDNCSEIITHDRHFAGIFLAECKQLLEVTDKGNRELYNRAIELIDARLSSLGVIRSVGFKA